MKTAIVYYSMSGNTAYVADRLKEQLDSEVDLIEIRSPTAASRSFCGAEKAQ